MLNWFAHLLQKPAQKSTHLIITGKQGTDKTIALSPIKKIMGGGYFESTQPERDVWGSFNPIMASSLLVVLSETDKRNSYGADGRIKALITDPEITINDKGIKPFVVKSFHRFITPTNSFDPVKMEDGDRRNMIIKMIFSISTQNTSTQIQCTNPHPPPHSLFSRNSSGRSSCDSSQSPNASARLASASSGSIPAKLGSLPFTSFPSITSAAAEAAIGSTV